MNKELKRTRLIELLRNITPEMREKLNSLKEGSNDLERIDFIWHFLFQSFATMGNAGGWKGLIGNQSNYTRVLFAPLSKLNSEKRVELIEKVLRDAKVRYAEKKSQWLNRNCDLIKTWGGLEKTRDKALACIGTEAKINFMKQFYGIGDKYARNIWMDVYHPDFHNSIAIDIRIKKITEQLGYKFTAYSLYERFYLEIAQEANLQGWELDRLLFNYKDKFIADLNVVEKYSTCSKRNI